MRSAEFEFGVQFNSAHSTLALWHSGTLHSAIVSFFYEVSRNTLSTWLQRKLQKPMQLLGLVLVQFSELDPKTGAHSVVPHLAFQVKPVSIGQQHAEPHDFTPANFPD